MHVLSTIRNHLFLFSTILVLHTNIFIIWKLGVNGFNYVIVLLLIFYVYFNRNKSDVFILNLKSLFILIFLVLEITISLAIFKIPFPQILNSLLPVILIPSAAAIYSKYRIIKASELYHLIMGFGLLTTFFTIYEFFFDKSLFGIYYYSNFYLENLIFRSKGNLSSPQVLGLYLILTSIFTFEYAFKNKRLDALFLAILFLITANLSGNRSVLILFLLYILLKVTISRLKKYLFLTVFILSIVSTASVLVVLYDRNIIENSLLEKTIDRIIITDSNVKQIAENERKGRLLIYENYLTFINENPSIILIGNGIGSVSSISRNITNRKIVTESYLLLLFVEYGFLITMFFLGIIIKSFFRNYKMKNETNFISIAILFISLFYVHAFLYPAFFVFWLLIFNKEK